MTPRSMNLWNNMRITCERKGRRGRLHYRFFAGGVPDPSSPAFRFVPNPNANFVRSPELGVPAPEADAGSETCEKLGFIIDGAGEFEFRPGPGLIDNGLD